MIPLIAEILPVAQEQLLSAFIVFLRVGAVVVMVPGFGEQFIPQRVKLVVALSFTLIVAPAVATDAQPLTAQPSLFWLGEVITGLALGAILRLLVQTLQIAGQVAAQATSLSQIFGGAGGDPQPALSHLLTIAGLALAAMTGLHVRAAEAMILSYDMLPPGRMPDAALLADWGVANIALGFGLAVLLAMPFVIASLIYNLALGVINKAMPQLMVAFVGAPAITAGGLILMVLAVPVMLEIWQSWLVAVLSDPFSVAR
ncbi:flagellar biosynthetic protein FliR [Actibacterium lipolyticum]|uniref:Flagellar biosynthesis protein FliR n=1 Tax=Actibacterium lipolyticum TaxID=1524263 RepID=A0A238KXN7_9RHOB|nr:flagellar biosynthetic protein FliR [Actibacterium lipolyticum]SMX47400.1 flagellar biosynthesis protein FliR [Actibacterium lipolyticum]